MGFLQMIQELCKVVAAGTERARRYPTVKKKKPQRTGLFLK